MNICYGFQFSHYFIILIYSVFLLFVKHHNKVEIVNNTRKIVVSEWESSCKVGYLCFLSIRCALRCWFGVLLSFFIYFVSKALSNSLELLFEYVISLFILSIDHFHFYILSNALIIVYLCLVFGILILLLCCILLFYW